MGWFGPSEKEVADKVSMVLNVAISGALGATYKFPDRARDDTFLLAYMMGALYNGYNHAGITSAKKQYNGAVHMFERFFPGEGRSIVEFCIQEVQAASQGANETVQETLILGMCETGKLIAGEGDAPAIHAHLVEHYA